MALPNLLKRAGCAVVGALAGVAMAAVVGGSLEQVTISPIFAIVFGCLLFVLSGVLAWRVRDARLNGRSRAIVVGGTVCVALSGGVCIALDNKIVRGLPEAVKVALYAFLSACLSFAFIYLALDVVMLFFTRETHTGDTAPMLHTDPQQRMLRASLTTAIGCVTTGLIYGLVFGLCDLEDPTSGHSLYRKLTYALGGIGGAVVALVNVTLLSDDDDDGTDVSSDEGDSLEDFGVNPSGI